jgi:hypothetical protein
MTLFRRYSDSPVTQTRQSNVVFYNADSTILIVGSQRSWVEAENRSLPYTFPDAFLIFVFSIKRHHFIHHPSTVSARITSSLFTHIISVTVSADTTRHPSFPAASAFALFDFAE